LAKDAVAKAITAGNERSISPVITIRVNGIAIKAKSGVLEAKAR